MIAPRDSTNLKEPNYGSTVEKHQGKSPGEIGLKLSNTSGRDVVCCSENKTIFMHNAGKTPDETALQDKVSSQETINQHEHS